MLRNRKDYSKNRDIKLEKAKINYINNLRSQGKLTKQEQIKILRENIISLKKTRIKNCDIANQLNIPIKTLEWYITYLKKNSLL